MGVGSLLVPVLAACARAARQPPQPPSATLRLHYARALRRAMAQPTRAETLTLRAPPNLATLREALAHRLPSRARARIQHGRLRVDSDEALCAVLAAARRLGTVPALRVVPDGELPIDVAPPPPPTHGDSEGCQLLSFFTFAPIESGRAPLLQLQLAGLLRRHRALGSVYVAAEGLNAQLAVPLVELNALRVALRRVRELEHVALNLAGEVAGAARPYRRLIVRSKAQALTDGLAAPLDLGAELGADGRELSPAEWHEALAARTETGALLLDCRNAYESSLGTFEGADALNTSVFSESWDALRARLEGVPRDTPVLTFCTGGIRCVKVNAWLREELGFVQTARLRDGIHGYVREVVRPSEAAAAPRPHYWRGDNFVFHQARQSGDEPECAS